jgi:hypothetical protein
MNNGYPINWLRFKDMSKKQRKNYLIEKVKMPSVQTQHYLKLHQTNRTKNFLESFSEMVSGKMDLSVERLQRMLIDVEGERIFREIYYA